MGDGFVIVTDFGEPSLDRPAAIAIALMRYVATTGIIAAAAIAEGDFADVIGCYPREIFLANNRARGIDMGQGVMTLSCVKRTALIRAYSVGKEAPSGPFLTTAEARRNRIPDGVESRITSGRNGKLQCSIN